MRTHLKTLKITKNWRGIIDNEVCINSYFSNNQLFFSFECSTEEKVLHSNAGLKATDVVYRFISSFFRLWGVYSVSCFVLPHGAKGKWVLTTELSRLPQQHAEAWSPVGRMGRQRRGDKAHHQTPKVTRRWTPARLSPTLVFRENVSPVFRLTLCGAKTESEIH